VVDYNTLSDFRNRLYGCFGNGKDAAMNLIDALISSAGVGSFPELSMSAAFERRWCSLYELFDDIALDRTALQRLFVSAIPPRPSGTRLVLGADATAIVRQESATARDRTYVHVSNVAKGAKPVAPGWQFATVAALDARPSSWVTILDNRRIQSDQTAGQVIVSQLIALAPQLPEGTVAVLDAGFGNAVFMELACKVPIGKLIRTAKNRTFYRPKPPPTGKRGRPREDGDPFSLHKPETHGPADEHSSGTDAQGNALEVDCWHGLHFKACREATVSLIRITTPNARDTKREPRTMWLIWEGEDMPPLSEIPGLYRLRYGIEHCYRFRKQDLLWTEPKLRTPEKFEAWTGIVDAAQNQITVAREYRKDIRQPWAKRKTEATPQQVRAWLQTIIALLGTPAKPSQPRGKSPGRLPGAVVKKAERFKVVFKESTKTAKIAA
jgi:hypothetical protein